ncbi:MAG: glycosyltransferase [Firmicutes bacterium]|nr:glycosyltransferase [Bacillota bacterium]
MKILIWSDGGAHTGYGTVTENLGRRWHQAGADVHVLAVNYRGDPWPSPLKLYPATRNSPRDVYGVGRLRELLDRVKPDIFFVLLDLYAVADGFQALKQQFSVPTVLYVPIDGIHVPRAWWEAPRAADLVVAMAEHGQRVMRQEASLEVEVLLHGVEHEAVFPASPTRPLTVWRAGAAHRVASKEEAKALLGLKDRFVILAINRNSVRKNYYDTFRVFDRFRRAHPDAFLYIHAAPKDEGGDLTVLAERYGLTREHLWIHHAGDTFVGTPKWTLTWLYNAADVKLSTSMAEGFGLTDAEALACGTPVVAQDFSATRDVVGPGGLLVKPARYFTTARMVDFALPDLDELYDALERLYQDAHLRRDLSEKAVSHARRYNWDRTASEFFRRFEALLSKGGRRRPESVVPVAPEPFTPAHRG